MGVRPPDLGVKPDSGTSPTDLNLTPTEDDLYADNVKTTFNFDHDLDFRHILLPAKGIFEDFLGANYWAVPEKKYCDKCYEDVKQDLKKLAEVLEGFKHERDAAKKETEELRKEVEELKKILKERDLKGDVKVSIANGEENLDVIVRSETGSDTKNLDKKVNNGVVSFSISLPKGKESIAHSAPVKPKKTIAELRREFFAKELESQPTFTNETFLEIKPEPEIFSSKLNIRVKPKKKISEIISKLTSKIGSPKVIPESTPICMLQRFEKTKTVWVSEFEEIYIA